MDGERELVLDDLIDLRRAELGGDWLADAGAAPKARGLDGPAGAHGRGLPLSLLRRTIEREVLPRLVLAHRPAMASAAVPGVAPVAAAAASVAGVGPASSLPPDVARLVALVLADDLDAPAGFVAERHRTGMPVAALYLDLLAPTARHLGWLWEEDLCDFTQVTLGLGRLHHLLRAFSVAFEGEAGSVALGMHALLVPAPGEQHTFGLAMVTEFFRRGGWTVWSGAPDSLEELLAIVRRQWFAVVGFSLACSTRVDALAAAIRRVRRASRNRSLGVMVGGPLFIAHPELVAMIGADATASDGSQAVLQARALLTLLADRE